MFVANIEGVEKAGEQVWQQDGYFGNVNPDYSCRKNEFPENCLVYINQAYLTVKEKRHYDLLRLYNSCPNNRIQISS